MIGMNSFLISPCNKPKNSKSAIMMATPLQVYSFITQNALTGKWSPAGFTCRISTCTSFHSGRSGMVLPRWQWGPSHLRVSYVLPSSAGSWLAATTELCQELVAPLLSLGAVHKGCKKQTGLTRTCWSICLNAFLEKKRGGGEEEGEERRNNTAEASVANLQC